MLLKFGKKQIATRYPIAPIPMMSRPAPRRLRNALSNEAVDPVFVSVIGEELTRCLVEFLKCDDAFNQNPFARDSNAGYKRRCQVDAKTRRAVGRDDKRPQARHKLRVASEE